MIVRYRYVDRFHCLRLFNETRSKSTRKRMDLVGTSCLNNSLFAYMLRKAFRLPFARSSETEGNQGTERRVALWIIKSLPSSKALHISRRPTYVHIFQTMHARFYTCIYIDTRHFACSLTTQLIRTKKVSLWAPYESCMGEGLLKWPSSRWIDPNFPRVSSSTCARPFQSRVISEFHLFA